MRSTNPINTDQMIFVFGSNLSGIHGAGAALFALNKRGAQWKNGFGPQGQSYAIPTKDALIRNTLPLSEIHKHVNAFIAYARSHPELTFQVTCIGCGLAGLKHENIAPMFEQAPNNCCFDELWRPWLGSSDRNYWGTF